MPQEWYYTSGVSEQNGPVNAETLKRLASSGQLRPTDHIWTDGMSQWIPASRLKTLFPENAVRQPTRPPVAQEHQCPSQPSPPPLPAKSLRSTSAAKPARERPSWFFPTVIGGVALLFVALIGLTLLIRAAMIASGQLGPSDGDIKETVTRYYRPNPSDFGVKIFPGGSHQISDCRITDVQILKRGKPFKPTLRESRWVGVSSRPLFPIRVSVKGTFRELYQHSDQPFEGEIDFVFYYVSPDKSKVDPGLGYWGGSPN